jgi:hypothetical protein
MCVGLGRWVEEGLVGGGGEAARVSRLPLWCERRGLAGMGGGGFPRLLRQYYVTNVEMRAE